jgi:hypothetical protein
MFQGLTLIAENIGSSGEPVESKAHLACDLLFTRYYLAAFFHHDHHHQAPQKSLPSQLSTCSVREYGKSTVSDIG